MARDKPFYSDTREAREKLQGLEDEFPGASWFLLEFRLKGEQKSSKERKEKKREKMKIGQKSTCSPP